MGNYCRYPGETNKCSSRRHRERICWKTKDNTWRNIAQLERNLTTQVNDEGITTMNLGGKINEIGRTLQVSMPEFVSINPENRPVGLSDEDWERFVSSTTFDFLRWDQDELEKEALMRNTKFGMSVPSSLSSVDALMGMSMKDCTPTLSGSETVSSVEFAGRFVLPDFYDDDTCSTSVWSLNTESSSLSQQNWASVRCLKEFSGTDEVRGESNTVLNSRCTTLCLKDIPSNSYEENLFSEEDNISMVVKTPIIGDGTYSTKEVFFNGIKVQLRIAQV